MMRSVDFKQLAKALRPVLTLLFLSREHVDLNLPKVSGLDVLDRIKKDPNLASIPVVVLTTSTSEEDRQRAYARRANSYLAKPTNFEEFHSLIQSLKTYWGRWNRQPA